MKELLGHSTIVVTMRYAHTNVEAKERAVLALRTSDKPVTVLRRNHVEPGSDSALKRMKSGRIGMEEWVSG